MSLLALALVIVGIFFGVLIFGSLIAWAFQDGAARGIPGFLLAIVLLLTFPWGPLVWFLLRERIYPQRRSRGFNLRDYRRQ